MLNNLVWDLCGLGFLPILSIMKYRRHVLGSLLLFFFFFTLPMICPVSSCLSMTCLTLGVGWLPSLNLFKHQPLSSIFRDNHIYAWALGSWWFGELISQAQAVPNPTGCRLFLINSPLPHSLSHEDLARGVGFFLFTDLYFKCWDKNLPMKVRLRLWGCFSQPNYCPAFSIGIIPWTRSQGLQVCFE